MGNTEDAANVIPSPASIWWGVLAAATVVGVAWLGCGPGSPEGLPRPLGVIPAEVLFPPALALTGIVGLATVLALDARVLRKWRNEGGQAAGTWWWKAYAMKCEEAHTQHVQVIPHLKDAADTYARAVHRRWLKYWVLVYALPVAAFVTFLLLLAAQTTSPTADRPTGMPSWSEIYPGLGLVSAGLIGVYMAILFVSRMADTTLEEWRDAVVQRAAADYGPSKPREPKAPVVDDAADHQVEPESPVAEEPEPDLPDPEPDGAQRTTNTSNNLKPKNPLDEYDF